MKVKSKSELLFRRAFIPWYDTDFAMLLTLAFAVAVLLFSITGVSASLDTPDYHAYIWVPCLLGLLSLIVTISTLIRLIRRGNSGST
jgi:O-antigen/teichoic acid export membrane protein